MSRSSWPVTIVSFSLAGLLGLPASAADPKPTADDAGGGMEIDIGLGEESQAQVAAGDPWKIAFEKAQNQMNAEDYASATQGFAEVLAQAKAKDYHPQAEYHLAKSLYRLGYYHAALARFVSILKQGDQHKYFKTSKEWLFFISRKSADQAVVLEEIARYAGADLPEKYADEFHYLLGKLYFNKAVDEDLKTQEKIAPPKPGEGDMEFDSDSLGSGGDDGLEFGEDALEDTGKKDAKKGQKKGGADKAVPEEKKPEIPQALQIDEASDAAADDLNAPIAVDESKLVAGKKEALDKCVEHTNLVPNTSNLYLRSVYLRAVCYYELQDFEKAVEGFKEVVRMTNPKTGKYKGSALREEAFFSLARTHYGFQQFRAAIFYYNKISRDSDHWLDALFESSWAYFRLADYERALGNLVTIHAPFFTDEYFPESLILKAVTYYENCRYPESLQMLGEFEHQYGPLRDELERLTKDAKTPDHYYTLLRKLETQKNASALSTRLIKLARGDRTLAATTASAAELEREEKKIASGKLKGTPLAEELLAHVKKRREALADLAGQIARAKLEGERDELKALSGQLLRIKFEVTKREKEGLEASLRGETMTTTLEGYRYGTAVPDDQLYWPFDGEYWRDELGTYEYTLSKGCRQ